jgi:Tetratricopeptide repeat/NB-ARC domain
MTTPAGVPPQDPGGGTRIEMRGESSDSSTFTQIGTQVNYQPPLPEQAFRSWAELAAPAGLSNLPRPGLFVGREGELARLDTAMATPGGVVVQAVHGLGGIGKSTLAARWAAAHATEYVVTWWITAATGADIDAGLADLAVALQPALTGVLPLEALREGAVQWLAAHSGWLLILDNVTDPADVAPLLARASAGRYLITSRRASGWHATGVAPVRLDVLDPAEAQALLAAILSSGRPQEADGTAELCGEVGFLPLAIEQAGAYLAQTGATPRQYLDLLARYPAAMYQAAAEGGDAARTIARIWHVTLDGLAGDPLAGQVLRILAWYAPDAIPRALLDGLADPPEVLRAVGRLAAYNMLTAGPGTLAMHRLVQAVTRTPDPGDPHRNPQAIDDARDQAIRQLAGALPSWQDPAGWPGWRMLLPHIDALASHAPPDTDTQGTAYLLNQAGLFLDGQGQPGRAAGYFQRGLADCVRVLGQGHPQTLASRNNLAGAYRAAGNLGRAISLYKQVLADQLLVLGTDHPHTLLSRNNLAAPRPRRADHHQRAALAARPVTRTDRGTWPRLPVLLERSALPAGRARGAGQLLRPGPRLGPAVRDRRTHRRAMGRRRLPDRRDLHQRHPGTRPAPPRDGHRPGSFRPAGLLGLGHWVAHHQPGPYRARDLRRGAGSCQGERGALGERGELRGEGPEGLRQGRGHDDKGRAPRVDRPGQLRERGVHAEIVDPPSAAVQGDAEDHQRQVVKLPWGAGQDGAGAVPVPPAPGQPSEPPADDVGGEVFLGDAGCSPLPALPELGEIRQHHVPEDRGQGEVGQELVQGCLCGRLIEGIQGLPEGAGQLTFRRWDAVSPGGPAVGPAVLSEHRPRRLGGRQAVGEVSLHPADPQRVRLGVQPEAAR